MRFFVRCETLAHVPTQLAFSLTGTEKSEILGSCPKNARAPHVLWAGELTVALRLFIQFLRLYPSFGGIFVKFSKKSVCLNFLV